MRRRWPGGACVLVNSRAHPGDDVPAAERVARAIRGAGGKAVANLEVVESPGAGVRIIEAALEAFGRVDVVIANAGVSVPAAFHREPLGDLRALVESICSVRSAWCTPRCRTSGRSGTGG
jgi:NAD(P)-dependent dehydrogenase (short-subunit alcohol dehydrogenase family)